MKRTIAIVAIILIVLVILYFVAKSQGWFGMGNAVSSSISKENPNVPTNPEPPASVADLSKQEQLTAFLDTYSGKFIRVNGTQKPIFLVAGSQRKQIPDSLYTYWARKQPGPVGQAINNQYLLKLQGLVKDVDAYYFRDDVVPLGENLTESSVVTILNS